MQTAQATCTPALWRLRFGLTSRQQDLMDNLWLSVRLLLLLAAANGAPLLAKRLFGTRWSAPLDGGYRFFDGRPLLGPSKTVRGLVAAVATSTLLAVVLQLPAGWGALMGAAAMLGDALSSFAKRRLGVAPSGRATGIDQIPEALLPLLVVQQAFGLTGLQIVLITLVFFLLEIPLARLFFRLGVRDQPY